MVANSGHNSACIVSIIRLAFLHTVDGIDITCKSAASFHPVSSTKVSDRTAFQLESKLTPNKQKDSLVSPLNWTVIECSLGIICVSVPPMRPLFSRLVPNFFPSHLSGTRAYGTRTGQRTQEEMLEGMNRELDRQLLEFEKLDHGSQKTRPVSADGSTVELTAVTGEEHGRGMTDGANNVRIRPK